MIARRCQQRKRNAQRAAYPAEKVEKQNQPSNEANIQDKTTIQGPDYHATRTPKRDTPCCTDTEMIVSELAGLAATVSRSSPKNNAHTKRSSSMRTVMQPSGNKEEPEEENFQYLHSLITVSCSRSSLSTSTSEDKESQPISRKRTSSTLSLRLKDLSGLPFGPKVSRKPCPRYTCLPPAWSPRPIAIRPEVRF